MCRANNAVIKKSIFVEGCVVYDLLELVWDDGYEQMIGEIVERRRLPYGS